MKCTLCRVRMKKTDEELDPVSNIHFKYWKCPKCKGQFVSGHEHENQVKTASKEASTEGHSR